MSNDNNNSEGCGCTGCLFWIAVFILVFVYKCDTKRFVADGVKSVRECKELIDSVWYSDTIKDTTNSKTLKIQMICK